MVISVMGRDGVGKSSVAKVVGRYLARDGLTLVVNTDITLPTTIRQDSGLKSLGHYLSLSGRHPVAPYLQQHEKISNLFFAGTSMGDDIFSSQADLDKEPQAEYFIEEAAGEVSHVVIDLSGQWTDPFLPAVVRKSDILVFMATCNAEGINSIYAMERILRTAKCPVRIALSQIQRYHDTFAFEKACNRKVDYCFSFSAELARAADLGKEFGGEGKTGKVWDREARRIVADLLELRKREETDG